MIFMVDIYKTRPIKIEVLDLNGNIKKDAGIQLFIIQNYDFNEGQNINTRYSPYTTAGKTQNLGRQPMVMNLNARLLKKNNELSKLFEFKRKRFPLRIILGDDHILDSSNILNTGKFYLADVQVVVEAPNYIDVKLPLVEVLDSNLKKTNVNLVQGAFANDFKKYLKQIYGVV